jgi:hypothetical protein
MSTATTAAAAAEPPAAKVAPKAVGNANGCCSHDGSCSSHCLKALLYNFIIASNVRGAVSVLARAIRLAQSEPRKLLSMHDMFGEGNLVYRVDAMRIGLFFGVFSAAYKVRRSRRRRRRVVSRLVNSLLLRDDAGPAVHTEECAPTGRAVDGGGRGRRRWLLHFVSGARDAAQRRAVHRRARAAVSLQRSKGPRLVAHVGQPLVARRHAALLRNVRAGHVRVRDAARHAAFVVQQVHHRHRPHPHVGAAGCAGPGARGM